MLTTTVCQSYRTQSSTFTSDMVSVNLTASGTNSFISIVVVVGHSFCGGCGAALNAYRNSTLPDPHLPASAPINRWLQPLVQLVTALKIPNDTSHSEALSRVITENIKAQVNSVASSDTIQHAWGTGQTVYVHGWMYYLEYGRIVDLNITQGPR